jgi:hypothetical protein
MTEQLGTQCGKMKHKGSSISGDALELDITSSPFRSRDLVSKDHAIRFLTKSYDERLQERTGFLTLRWD